MPMSNTERRSLCSWTQTCLDRFHSQSTERKSRRVNGHPTPSYYREAVSEASQREHETHGVRDGREYLRGSVPPDDESTIVLQPVEGPLDLRTARETFGRDDILICASLFWEEIRADIEASGLTACLQGMFSSADDALFALN